MLRIVQEKLWNTSQLDIHDKIEIKHDFRTSIRTYFALLEKNNMRENIARLCNQIKR